MFSRSGIWRARALPEGSDLAAARFLHASNFRLSQQVPAPTPILVLLVRAAHIRQREMHATTAAASCSTPNCSFHLGLDDLHALLDFLDAHCNAAIPIDFSTRATKGADPRLLLLFYSYAGACCAPRHHMHACRLLMHACILQQLRLASRTCMRIMQWFRIVPAATLRFTGSSRQ